MMSVIENLVSGTKADKGVLNALSSHGDNFSIARDVDFMFRTQARPRAEELMRFINDNQYSSAVLELAEEGFSVVVKVNTPILQAIIFSISGFMACLAALFGFEYDGWGCPIRRTEYH
jgi:hypothetical protein